MAEEAVVSPRGNSGVFVVPPEAASRAGYKIIQPLLSVLAASP